MALRTVAVVLTGSAGQHAEPGAGAPPVLLAGRPAAERCVAAFRESGGIDEIVVVAGPGEAAGVAAHLAVHGCGKVSRVIEGDGTRAGSVRLAIDALGPGECNVLIHDGARALVSQRTIDDCVAALGEDQAVCAAVPVSDTIVAVFQDCITERTNRDRLRSRQTPQGFRLSVLRRGHELARVDQNGTGQGITPDGGITPDVSPAPDDDCGIVLRYLPEITVRLVPGDPNAFPVTRQVDAEIAEALLRADATPRADAAPRVSA
jgi:ribitol-5-phosphate 2-dehydrogenase (NADP+) / D-ribitol-5-phosphate cytidylyltransferase